MRGDIALLRRSTKALNAAISTATGPPAPVVYPIFGREGDCDVLGPGESLALGGKRDEDCSLACLDVVKIVGLGVESSSSWVSELGIAWV